MSQRTINEQLIKFLTDVHSIEVQALAQMERAPDIAGDAELARIFAEHLDETRWHERLVLEVLTQRGADTSTLKDLTGRVGAWAMIAFARLNPDTPGKLVAHAFSYEHMELAAYGLLQRAAGRAADPVIEALAQRIGDEEQAMGRRLAAAFDQAVDASLRVKARLTSALRSSPTSRMPTLSRCRRCSCSRWRPELPVRSRWRRRCATTSL